MNDFGSGNGWKDKTVGWTDDQTQRQLDIGEKRQVQFKKLKYETDDDDYDDYDDYDDDDDDDDNDDNNDKKNTWVMKNTVTVRLFLRCSKT